jgi:hypothetical protein
VYYLLATKGNGILLTSNKLFALDMYLDTNNLLGNGTKNSAIYGTAFFPEQGSLWLPYFMEQKITVCSPLLKANTLH